MFDWQEKALLRKLRKSTGKELADLLDVDAVQFIRSADSAKRKCEKRYRLLHPQEDKIQTLNDAFEVLGRPKQWQLVVPQINPSKSSLRYQPLVVVDGITIINPQTVDLGALSAWYVTFHEYDFRTIEPLEAVSLAKAYQERMLPPSFFFKTGTFK